MWQAAREEIPIQLAAHANTNYTTRHPQLQPALSSAGTDKWVLSWRLNEDSVGTGDRNAVTTLYF